MKLRYFKGHQPNFGDELNEYVWPRILPPGFLDNDETELFVGIGSILEGGKYPDSAKKHVFGSGYAGYGHPPVLDENWNIVFVRGPRTAARLGLPKELAIADSAILLRAFSTPTLQRDIPIAFMPHYQSLDWGLWGKVCELAGIELIDPRDSVESILDRLSRTQLLITEAMHGAIVADALRTPWISVKPIWSAHHVKWLDWAEALSIDLRQTELQPTTLLEAWIKRTGRGSMSGTVGKLSSSPLMRPVNALLTHRAASTLKEIAKAEPQLSSDSAIARATERALEATNNFVRSRT
jgi:succinoglycan biosynthesis protein ExoV